MIKSRSKSFAPKKAVSRVPSRAPSSARPSVERQLQTPAPSQPARETVPSISEDIETLDTISSTSQVSGTPSRSRSGQQTPVEPSVSVFENLKPVSSLNTLKRKTRDNEEPEPPTKRIPAEVVGERSRNVSPEEPVRNRVSRRPALIPIETLITAQNTSNRSLDISSRPSGSIAAPDPTIPAAGPLFQRPHTSTTQLPTNSTAIQATPVPNIEDSTPKEHDSPGGIRRSALEQPVQPSQPSLPLATQLHRETPIASVETNDGNESRTLTPEEAAIPEAPRFRYPSPQNIVRISDIPIAPRPGDFGPIGGSSMSGPAGSGGPGLGAAGAIGGPIRIGAVLRNSDVVPRATLNPDGTSGVVDDSASGTEKGKKKKKNYTKRKRILKDGDNVRATIDMQVANPRRKSGTGKRASKRKEKEEKRKARDPTPEGASDEEIDPAALTMTDLCKDLRIGKKFSMHDEIRQRVVARKKSIQAGNMIRDHSEIPDIERLVNGGLTISQAAEAGEAGPSGTNRDETSPPPDPSNRGLQLIMVDNQIVLDTNSTSLNRHQRAAQNEQATEAVEENDFTRIITSGTYMKRERAQLWDYPATDLFYKGLRMFGTDFEMIAKLFPHRNRRQIKLKFGREEACNMERINRALLGQKEPIDLEQFTKFSNIKLESVEEIEEEQRKIEEEQNAELARIEAEAAEETRKKKEQIMGRSGAGGNTAARVLGSSEFDDPILEGSGASGIGVFVGRGRKGAKGKQKRNKNSIYGLGGEEVEIVQVGHR